MYINLNRVPIFMIGAYLKIFIRGCLLNMLIDNDLAGHATPIVWSRSFFLNA